MYSPVFPWIPLDSAVFPVCSIFPKMSLYVTSCPCLSQYSLKLHWELTSQIRFFDLDLLRVLDLTPYSNDTVIFPSHSHNSNLQSVSSPAPNSPSSLPLLFASRVTIPPVSLFLNYSNLYWSQRPVTLNISLFQYFNISLFQYFNISIFQ